MMQLWDRKQRRPVYTTCVQPFAPYKRKRSHLKVRCVTKDEGYSMLIFCLVGWGMFITMFVRWWFV